MLSVWTSLALSAMALTALAHPHRGRKDDEVIYDQRQNGTENYRLHIDGVVVALAPAEVLFNLAGLMDGFLPDGGGGGGGDELPEDDLYPPPKPDAGEAGETALTTQPAAEASSTASTSTEAAVAEEEEIPNRDTTENAEKPATSETAQAQKPPKKLKGKIFLSRWLLPLMRRLI